MRQDELYHSSVYLGKDYSDGIRHWKYIKRERKNGKWVYYYSNAEYNAAKSRVDAANKALADYDNKRNAATKTYLKAKDDYYNAAASGKKSKIKKAGSKFDAAKAKYDEYSRGGKKAQKIYDEKSLADLNYGKVNSKTGTHRQIGEMIVNVANKASDTHHKINKAIKKTKIKKNIKKTINKGKKAIAKLLKSKKGKSTTKVTSIRQ